MSPHENNDIDKIYFDYNATTPLAKEVIENISKSIIYDWGNPSSSHCYGIKSRNAISIARRQIADMVNGDSSEIIFTSGGTESNNMIIYGAIQYFKMYKKVNTSLYDKPHIITSNVEHDSVLLPILYLANLSFIECTIVKVNSKGSIDVNAVMSEIRDNTCLITIMLANNETGVIMEIPEMAKSLRKLNPEREDKKLVKILLHTDAAQAIGKERVNANELGVDYMTIVGHKFYGPRIGCIWSRGPLFPMLFGGGQESNLRPGTENTPMIVGLGVAASLVSSNIDEYKSHFLKLRNLLERRLKEVFGEEVVINCEDRVRLPNTVNVSFVGNGLEGNLILSYCKYLIASVGAACHGVGCSQVLVNSGVPVHLAKNAIRLSVGRETTSNDVETVVSDLKQAVTKLKEKC